MRIPFLRHMGPMMIFLVMGVLAVTAPQINANAGPPPSVFLALEEEAALPKVALEVWRDAHGHWQVQISASDFQFTELCLTEAAAVPIGHAHVIRNGVKVASAYYPIVDLGQLPQGRHVIDVVLRGQDHRALVGPDGLITAQAVINVTTPRRLVASR